MCKGRWTVGVILAAGLGFGISAPTLFGTAAAEQEYVSKAKALTLHHEPLANVEGKEIIIKHFSFPPNFVGGKHMHPASVFVYVLKGELTIESEGETLTFKAGELYPEPLGSPMVASNQSGSVDLEVLVFQVGDQGKPMMVKVE